MEEVSSFWNMKLSWQVCEGCCITIVQQVAILAISLATDMELQFRNNLYCFICIVKKIDLKNRSDNCKQVIDKQDIQIML